MSKKYIKRPPLDLKFRLPENTVFTANFQNEKWTVELKTGDGLIFTAVEKGLHHALKLCGSKWRIHIEAKKEKLQVENKQTSL